MQGMATIGATMHFGYTDILEMETKLFYEFVKIANDMNRYD
jgi:hypothetical protein